MSFLVIPNRLDHGAGSLSVFESSRMERPTCGMAKAQDDDLVFADAIIDQIGIRICWRAPDAGTTGGASCMRPLLQQRDERKDTVADMRRP